MQAPYSRALFDLLREQAERSPDATAVIDAQRTLSYRELLERSRSVAAALRREGIARGDRVGALISNWAEWLELLFASGAVGAAFVPFSTWSTRAELAYLLADAEVNIVFAVARCGDRDFVGELAELAPELRGARCCADFSALSRVVVIDGGSGDGFTSYLRFTQATPYGSDLPPGLAASASDDALVLYTSGSSARPKAVRLKHYGVIENGFNIGERMGLCSSDRVLLAAPLFWSYGAANALPATMTHGGVLVLQERFEAGGAIDLIERHGCTAIYTLPAMTTAIGRHPKIRPERLRSLRTGLTIGSPAEFYAAVRTLGAAELCNVYGATETYGNCCVSSRLWTLEKRATTQGQPLPGNVIRLVDSELGERVGPSETGLVEVRGYVTPGYSGASADQNAAAFTPDGFYRTGDAGRLDKDGSFVFVARHSEMIKRAGINVSPAEVEEILLKHARVAQAAVVGAPDSGTRRSHRRFRRAERCETRCVGPYRALPCSGVEI